MHNRNTSCDNRRGQPHSRSASPEAVLVDRLARTVGEGRATSLPAEAKERRRLAAPPSLGRKRPRKAGGPTPSGRPTLGQHIDNAAPHNTQCPIPRPVPPCCGDGV